MKTSKPSVGRFRPDGVMRRRATDGPERESLAQFLARGGEIVTAPPAETESPVREVTASPRVYGYVMLAVPSRASTSEGHSRIPDPSEIRRSPESDDGLAVDPREDVYDVTHRTASGNVDDD